MNGAARVRSPAVRDYQSKNMNTTTNQKPLSPRQADALREIEARQETREVGPTIAVLAAAMGVHQYAVQRHVAALRAKGWVEPESGFGLVVVKRGANAEGSR